MKNFLKSKTFIILLAIVIIVVIIFALIVKNYKTEKFLNQENQEKVANEINKNSTTQVSDSQKKVLEIAKSELFLGDENAKITIVEYASLSCPHCASFYLNAFEKLNEEYIETKKVKFVYRDFPLNQPALAGAMVAICRSKIASENQAQNYYNFVKALYKNQDSWAFDENFIAKLESIAFLDGMSQEQFNACVEDKKLQEQILKARLIAAQSLNLASTPTFYINDEIVEGFIDYKTLKKVIEKELNK